MKTNESLYDEIRDKFIKEGDSKFLALSDNDQHNIVLAIHRYYELLNSEEKR